MPKSRNVYQEGTKLKSMCRVCLTQSNTVMYKLTDNLECHDIPDGKTYLEVLEKTTFCKVKTEDNYPEVICPMCVSLLKMSYQFVTQFKESQKKLKLMFRKSNVAYFDSEKLEEEKVIEAITAAKRKANYKDSPVQIIIKNEKYSLSDLIVVEDPESEEHNYEGFIQKLGKELSATIINSSRDENAVTLFDGEDIKTDEEETEYEIERIENEFNTVNLAIIKKETDNYDEIESIENESYISKPQEINSDCEDPGKEKNGLSILNDPKDLKENGIVEFIIEECDEDEQNTEEPVEMNSDENSEGQNYEENEDSESENGHIEYIEIDALDKDTIESLIIDRGEDNPENEDGIQTRKRKRRRKERDDPKDEFEQEMKFPCGICKKIYSHERALKNHVKRAHIDTNEQMYTCEICGHISGTKSKFVTHKLQHVEKQFKCELCGKAYSTKAHLKVHMGIHENRRPFLCNVCGKDFNYANALTYHMRLHTGEKNYHCEYCPQRFRMINSLNRHVRTHTGEKPYKCQFCGRDFSSKGEVVCHEYIHTGYRPYHCKYCKKGFSKTHNLKIHLLSHKGPYHCNFCGKSFIETNILNMHLKISHKDQFFETNKEDENSESNEGSQDEAFSGYLEFIKAEDEFSDNVLVD